MKKYATSYSKPLLVISLLIFVSAFLSNIENMIFGGSAAPFAAIASFLWTGTALSLMLLSFNRRTAVYDCITGIYSLWLSVFSIFLLLDNLPGIRVPEHMFTFVSAFAIGTPYTGFVNVIENLFSSLFPQANAAAIAWFTMSAIGMIGIAFSTVSIIKRHTKEKISLQQTAT